MMQKLLVVMAVAALGRASAGDMLDRTAGGFQQVALADDNKDDFFTATSDPANYARANDPFVCVTSFDKVFEQVVSGTNYKFHVHGCAVDATSKAEPGCKCGSRAIQKFVIAVYSQSWTDTYEVTKVSVVP